LPQIEVDKRAVAYADIKVESGQVV